LTGPRHPTPLGGDEVGEYGDLCAPQHVAHVLIEIADFRRSGAAAARPDGGSRIARPHAARSPW
jgi:hypothetical protein